MGRRNTAFYCSLKCYPVKRGLIFCWTLEVIDTCLTFRALKKNSIEFKTKSLKIWFLFVQITFFSVLYYKLQFFQQLLRIVVLLTCCDLHADRGPSAYDSPCCDLYRSNKKTQTPSHTDEYVKVSPVGYPTLLVITLECFLYQIIPPLWSYKSL